jgi:hypothetical protein
MNLIEEVEKQRHHVLVENYSATWNELMSQYSNEDIEIDPAYQRAFRWDKDQQTKYIESLLLNIPTPPIFLAEKDNGAFEVIDGLQRFSTIIKFFAAEVFNNLDESRSAINDRNDINNIKIPTVLSLAPILKKLDGMTRESMPETLVRTLRYSRVQVILLKKESAKIARYNVFTRLNRAGTTLSNQEIRNCSARLVDTDFAAKLMEMAEVAHVSKALGLSNKETASMGVQENILRLISFSHFSPQTKSIEEFLDTVMYEVSSGDFKFTLRMEKNILETFFLLNDACPNGDSFKFYRGDVFKGAFSPNLFDIIACGVYKNITRCKAKSSAQLRRMIVNMHSNADAISLTGAGSNTRSKMMGRVNFGKQWFSV